MLFLLASRFTDGRVNNFAAVPKGAWSDSKSSQIFRAVLAEGEMMILSRQSKSQSSLRSNEEKGILSALRPSS